MKVTAIHISSASELVSRLRISADEWGTTDTAQSTWVFRGHANAKWTLLPSAQRDGNALQDRGLSLAQTLQQRVINAGITPVMNVELAAQHIAEAQVLLRFNNLCNDIGLPRLQSTANRINPRIYSAIAGTEQFSWEPSVLHGVAQHHGIPTRLLDWSFDPLIAAFFAAHFAIRDGIYQDQNAAMAVWAFDSWAIPMFRGLARVYEVDNEYSRFIHAQRGLFTWVDGDEHFSRTKKWMTFDEAILHDLESENKSNHDDLAPSKWANFSNLDPNDVIRKFQIPAKEAIPLLRILRRERKVLAYLMPTLDNVASTVMDEWQFNNSM